MKFETLREAWAYTLEHGEDIADPRCAGRQFEAAQQVDGLRERHENGDTTALPYALATCAHHGLVMPEWLADAVYSGIVRWHNFETRTLDEALGVSRKGRRGPDELNYRHHAKAVFFRVLERRIRGQGVDAGMFDEVAKEMGSERIGHFTGGTAKNWYYRYIDENKDSLNGLDEHIEVEKWLRGKS